MKHKFQLPDFPNSNFEIETAIWTGKSKLLKDNIQVEQSKDGGRPFLIPNGTSDFTKAFPKQSFPTGARLHRVPTSIKRKIGAFVTRKIKTGITLNIPTSQRG